MEKRVFLALFLSFLVLYGYQAFFVKPIPKRPPAAAPSSAASGSPGAASTTTTSDAPQVRETAPDAPAEAPLAGAARIAAASEQDVPVKTAVVDAVFTTRGGALKSWRLKRFHDRNGRPLELIPSGLPPSERPFLLESDDPAISGRLRGALMRPSTATVDASTSAQTLTFEYEEEGGLHVAKTFHFEPASYVTTVSLAVSNAGQPVNPIVSMGAGLGDPIEASARGVKASEGIIFDTKVRRLNVSALAKQNVYQGNLRYSGVEDQYFLSSILLDSPATVEFRPVVGPLPPDSAPNTRAHEYVSYRLRFATPPPAIRAFIGPKEFDVLSAIHRDFGRVIDFGMFDILVVPLLRSLKWVNGFVGNYGWSIVLLTVFINALMFPLRHKSVVSMRKMQELQPQVKAIQDRYGKLKTTDPERQKMNTELMNLYREKGVNPASGCVPMLLTLPVLFAFYALLAGAIEIRGEPFIGWIRDLSAPDPLYITPVVMAITMFIQQKMTPSTADPAQQKMMMVMPLVMGVMFLNFSSGLVLYWLVSNLWAIGQQYLTNRIIGPPVVRPVRPASGPKSRRVPAASE
jgi:YidC/Oxa1 family membrane protein insertase